MRQRCNSWIVYLSTFPPRECGIATFTKDLADAFDDSFSPMEESRVVALNNNEADKFKYPKSVIIQIDQTKKESYIKAAQKLNILTKVKMICIQHEFGIHGGENGSNLLWLLREIKKPVVIVLHTVVPSSNQFYDGHKNVIKAINDYVRLIIVMTKTSEKILINDYRINPDKIRVIPHGIHASQYQNTLKAKMKLNLRGQTVLSTFGLLNRGKGIEYALEAMVDIIKKFPNAVYHIIGTTHPVIFKKEGESYRDELIQIVSKLGLDENVVFHNKYFSTVDILQFLRATDLYLSLSLDPSQAVSGTLSYALGSGRPVISTAFAQAKEDVTNEVGRLVEFKNPKAISEAAIELLENKDFLEEMGKRAYFRTRRMTWQNVVLSYMREFVSIVPEIRIQETNLPKVKLKQIIKLTDNFGMFQFSKLTEPDPESGYTLDDNARALIAVTEYNKKYGGEASLKLAKIYLEFIEYAFSSPGCNNYVNHDRSFNIERNMIEDLSDAYARGIYSLAVVAASSHMPLELRNKAAKIFKEKFNIKKTVHAPRSVAFYIKAIYLWLDYEDNEKYKKILKRYCRHLIELYKKNSQPDWQWFEDTLAYSNGVIPEALFLAYRVIKDQRYFNIAKSTLDFLVANSFNGDVCVPVGQKGWFKRGNKKTIFDQQPEEIAALVLALRAAGEVSGDEKYVNLMRKAFDWFLGNNVLGQVVYSHISGGSYDGVGEKTINLNQGAESTVSYLIARLALE
ncbi:glycosyltransferase [Patescibacteria group bacterium]|nr:glycosyltransferase [Patescibacteria group bacterium]